MKKLLLSSIVLGLTSVLTIGATTAYFSDIEVSAGNTFTAGTLDLKIDGGDVNVSRSFGGLRPVNSQPNFGYVFKNAGTVNGNLRISDISIVDYENGCLEPETTSGDNSCGDLDGELSRALNIRIWVDTNWDGYITGSESAVYNGPVYGLNGSSLNLNEVMTENEEVRVGMIIDWWNNYHILDNLAQGDSFVIDFTFSLEQVTD